MFAGMRHFLLLFLSCCACTGQSLSIGITGGGRPTGIPLRRFVDPGDFPFGERFVFRDAAGRELTDASAGFNAL